MRIFCLVLAVLVILFSLLLFIVGKIHLCKLPKDESFITYNSYKLNKDYDLWLSAQRIYNKYCVQSSYFLIPFTVILSIFSLVFIKNNYVLFSCINGMIIIFFISFFIVKSKTDKDIDKLIKGRR